MEGSSSSSKSSPQSAAVEDVAPEETLFGNSKMETFGTKLHVSYLYLPICLLSTEICFVAAQVFPSPGVGRLGIVTFDNWGGMGWDCIVKLIETD